MFLLALGFTSVATAFDIKERRIPNLVSGGLLVVSALLVLAGRHPLGWRHALYGLLVATLVSMLGYAKGALGGGDVKLLAALGLTLGLMPFLVFLVSTSLAGGVLAILAARRGQTDIAYAPAMWLGLIALLPLTWMS